jgi:hypothetical protein
MRIHKKFLFGAFSFCVFLSLLIASRPGFSDVVKRYSGSLLAYYDFNELKGNFLEDNSGRKNHARISGTKTFWSEEGVFGGAGYFRPGTRVIVNDSRRLSRGGELTIMMWIKPEGIDGRMKLLSKRSYQSQFSYYLLGIDQGRPFAGLGDGESFDATPKTKGLSTNEWHHVCATLDRDGYLKIFLEGKLSESVKTYQSGYNTGDSNLSIGSDFQGAEGYFQGMIDEVILLNRAIEEKEILKEVKRAKIITLRKISPEDIAKNPDRFLSSAWPLNEGRGKEVKNVVKPSYPGKLSPGLESRWQEGFLQNSLSFNGKNDFIQIPPFAAIELTRSFSLLCWIRPETNRGTQRIVHKISFTEKDKFYSLGVKDGSLFGGVGNGKQKTETTREIAVAPGKWHQVGMLYDHKKEQLSLVHNGQIVDTVKSSNAITGKVPLVIGGNPIAKKDFFAGEIADLRIYFVDLPPEVLTRQYRETVRTLSRVQKEREKRERLRTELKKAFRELNELNELLGEEDRIKDIAGREEETLKQVRLLIRQRLEALEQQKKMELEKLRKLVESAKVKEKQLNDILNRLKQPPYRAEIPEITEKSGVKEIINAASEIRRLEVEIELLIRQKQKELELKEELQKKKQARLKEQILSNVNTLNELNNELGRPPVKVDSRKLDDDLEKYAREISRMIVEREKAKESMIRELKSKIIGYRKQITDLYIQLKEYTRLMGDEPPKEVDLTSPLVDDLERLKRIADFEVQVIEQWTAEIERYKKLEKQKTAEINNRIREAVKTVNALDADLKKTEKETGIESGVRYELPAKQDAAVDSLKQAVDRLESLTALQKTLGAEIDRLRSLFMERQKEQALKKYNRLKIDFKKTRSRLLILNSELDISEEWELPKARDRKIFELNEELENLLARMESLIAKREKQLREIRKKREQQRKQTLADLRETVRELNRALRFLGLPEYPEQKPKPGEEQDALQKFRAELEKRKLEVKERKELEKKLLEEKKQRWIRLIEELALVNRKLGLPAEKGTFNPDTADEDLKRLSSLLEQRTREWEQKREKQLDRVKQSIQEERSKDKQKITNLIDEVKRSYSRILAIDKKLDIETPPLEVFPWEKKELEKLEGYYRFDETDRVVVSDNLEGEYMEFIEWTQKSMVEGRYNRAYQFDGNRQYARLPFKGIDEGDVTVMFWVKPGSVSGKQTLLKIQNESEPEAFLAIMQDQSSLTFEVSRDRETDVLDTGILLNRNEWMHLTLTLSNRRADILINGQNAWRRRIARWPDSMNLLTLGGGENGKHFFFGVIDDLKIYSRIPDDEELVKGGLELPEATLDFRIRYLEKRAAELSNTVKKKEEELKRIELEEKHREERERREFMEGLKKLNELHRKLDEREETMEDFELIEPQYRKSILESRIRRAQRRYKAYLEQIEAKRKETLGLIEQERAKLKTLYEKLEQTGELFLDVPEGSEDKILKKIRELIFEKEAEYQKRQQDREQRLRYIQVEMQKIHAELKVIRSRMNKPQQPIPQLVPGKEEEIFSNYRKQLSAMQESLAEFEEVQRKRFAQLSGEIEKIWEQLLPVLREIGEPMEKPGYEMGNAAAVLEELRRKYDVSKAKLETLKKERRQRYLQAKQELEKCFAQLQEVMKQLDEPVIFIPNYKEEFIFESLKKCRALLEEKQKQLEQLREKRKREEIKAIDKLSDQVRDRLYRIAELNRSLDISEENVPVRIHGNIPQGLKYYFPCDRAFKDVVFDWSLSLPLRLVKAEVAPTGDQKFSKAVFFNGIESYAELRMSAKALTRPPFSTLSFFFKPNRFWKTKSLVFVETADSTGVDAFLDQDRLKMRQIIDNEAKTVTEGTQITLNKWSHLVMDFDFNRKKVQLFVNNKLTDTLKIPPPSRLTGTVRFGSWNTNGEFFSGGITDVKFFSERLTPLNRELASKIIQPEFEPEARNILRTRIAELDEILKKRREEWQKVKKAQEKKRQTILEEIESLKTELAELKGKEKVIFSVVIGEEDKALEKLKKMVETARREFEARKKQEEERRRRLQDEIEKKEEILGTLIEELGRKKPVLQLTPGQEKLYLNALEGQIKDLTNEKMEKKIQIRQLRDKLNLLHEQLETPEDEIPAPDGGLNIPARIDAWNRLIEEAENRIAMKRRESLLVKWKAQYKTLQALAKEIGETPPQITPPEPGQEIEALSDLADRVNQARERLKDINARREEKLRRMESSFETYLSQLIPLLKELGQEDQIQLAFDASDPEGSIEQIRKLIADKTREVEEKRKREEVRFQELKETAEGFRKAIDEEKNRIKKYVRELKIEEYTLPTVLLSAKVKGLTVYFKFDNLKSKQIVDEIGNSTQSFFANFTEESRVVGKYGFAAQLNGLDQFIHVDLTEDILNSATLSVAFWQYPARTYGKRNLFTSLNEAKKSGVSVFIEDGVYKVTVTADGRDYFIQADESVKRKEWTHVALTVNGDNEITLYLDGKPTGRTRILQSFSRCLSSNLIMGSDFKKSLDLFSGKMDELKIYTTCLKADQMKSVMEEEVLRSEVTDIDLLKEEYATLQAESRRLYKKVQEAFKASEAERLKKVKIISELEEQIFDLHHRMGLQPFNYSFRPGNEEAAIEELKNILEEKRQALKEYRKQLDREKEAFLNEADKLSSQIDDYHQKLGIKKPYPIEYKKGLEDEILSKARGYLRQLEDEYAIFLRTQKQREKLKMREEIDDMVLRLNRMRETLKQPAYELNEIPDGREAEVLIDLKQKIKQADIQLAEVREKERLLRQEEERVALVREFRSLSREYESLQRDLNILEEETISKKDDPSARIYLSFDDGKGNLVKDKTVYGNRGTFLDYDFEWVDTGIYNKCVNFPGTGGTLVIYESPSLNEVESFSMMLWIRPARLYGSRRIVTVGEGDSSRLSLILQDERLIVGIGKEMLVDSGMSLKKDIWQHIAMIFDKQRNTVMVYVDGTLISEMEYPEKFQKYSILLNNPIYIGSNGKSDFFAGSVDEFKLFNKMLTHDEIQENKKEGIPKIDTSIEDFTQEQIQQRIRELEEKVRKLREQKIIQEQKERARQKQLLLENKILREAEHRKHLRIFKHLAKEINSLRKELELDPMKFDDPEPQREQEAIEKLQAERLELLAKLGRVVQTPTIIKTLAFMEQYDREDSMFCHLGFEDIIRDRVRDRSPGRQEARFTTDISNWVRAGVTGDALLLGDHGYLRISNNQTVPYNLRQAMQFWINPDEQSVHSSFLVSRGNCRLEIRDAVLRVFIGEELVTFEEIGVIEPGKWTQVNLSINEFASKIQASFGKDYGITKNFSARLVNPDGPIYIGGSPEGAIRFKGLIDEFYVYHRLFYKRDLEFPNIYNCSIDGAFSRLSLGTVILELNAENVDYMRVYQEGKIGDSYWENFRNIKILPVVKNRDRKDSIRVIAELKNRFSAGIEEVEVEIAIPRAKNAEFVLPPPSMELTSASTSTR